MILPGISTDLPSFHLLPSGLVNPKSFNLIGSGVTFYVPAFFSELKDLEEKGLQSVRDRIFVSDRAHVNLDLHAAVDGLEEVEASLIRPLKRRRFLTEVLRSSALAKSVPRDVSFPSCK